MEYFPCLVTMKDGSKIDRVYVVSESLYLKHWGVPPEVDRGKEALDLQEVVSIEQSNSRLPARFANMLYAQGESSMGYFIFTVVFKSGLRQAYLMGGAVDFIDYPDGLTANDCRRCLVPRGTRFELRQRSRILLVSIFGLTP